MKITDYFRKFANRKLLRMKQIKERTFLFLVLGMFIVSCNMDNTNERSHSDKDFERVSVAVRQHAPEARTMVDSALAATCDSLVYYDYYFLLGSLYMVSAPDSILPCADRILQFTNRQEPSPRINGIAASAHNLRANYYYLYHQNTEQVLKENMEAYRLFMRSDLIKNAPDICANMGDAYKQVNRLPDAASWYRRAVVLADSINLAPRRKATYYMGLGVIYQMLEDYNLSEEYFEKSYECYDSLHVNMKLTYLNNYGNLQYFKKDYQKALSVFQQLDSLIGEYDLRGGFEDYLCRLNMADVLQNLGRTEESLSCLASADSFFRAKKVNDCVYYANTIRIANALRKDDMKMVGNIIATEPKNLTMDENMLDIRNRYLHDYFLKANNIPLANYYERIHNERKDSIDKDREHMRATDIVMRLTIDTLTLHNQLRMNEKNAVIQRNWLVSAIVVSIIMIIALALLVSTLFFRKRNVEKQQEIMDLKMSNVRNVITPHFTFNVLKHAMTFEDVHDAENTIKGVIKLMHSQIDMSRQMFVSLRKELDFTKNYVDTATATIGKNFTFRIVTPDNEVLDARLVPSTFVQILVENAIKHGLKGLDRPKTLTVEVIAKDDSTVIEVTDNGRGFDIRNQSSQFESSGTGTGLHVIQNTIDYYNHKKHREEMFFSVNNVKDSDGNICGCRSTLTLPSLITI